MSSKFAKFLDTVWEERCLTLLLFVCCDYIYCGSSGDGIITSFHKYNKEKAERKRLESSERNTKFE